jgi:CheY-like chemotaxis protein
MELDKKKILLIDDDAIVNEMNRFLISGTQIFDEIISKTAPKEALEYIHELVKNGGAIPGFILIDISMPEIDGFEFIDMFDEIFEENNIDVLPLFVILSSSRYKYDIEQVEKTPSVKRFLSKPLQKVEFLEVLKDNAYI